jgi:hypothetical protein
MSNIRFSDIIDSICSHFEINNKDLIQQHEFRCMGEKINDYLLSNTSIDNFCFLNLWYNIRCNYRYPFAYRLFLFLRNGEAIFKGRKVSRE